MASAAFLFALSIAFCWAVLSAPQPTRPKVKIAARTANFFISLLLVKQGNRTATSLTLPRPLVARVAHALNGAAVAMQEYRTRIIAWYSPKPTICHGSTQAMQFQQLTTPPSRASFCGF